jgi:hypothetical protein
VTAFDPQAIIDAVASHALATGTLERVNEHEPKSPPATSGITAAVWVESFGPAKFGSGLSATNALLVLLIRFYTSMLSEPQDAIDPDMLRALHAVQAALHGDFTLDATILPGVDLLGAQGTPMTARAGYIRQDDATYRTYTLPIPIVINDLWDQAP